MKVLEAKIGAVGLCRDGVCKMVLAEIVDGDCRYSKGWRNPDHIGATPFSTRYGVEYYTDANGLAPGSRGNDSLDIVEIL